MGKRNFANNAFERLKKKEDEEREKIEARSKMVDVASLRLDGGTQPRANLDDDTLAEYTERMRRSPRDTTIPKRDREVVDTTGKAFPPIEVFFDGTNHWLADGFHRVAAAKAAKLDTFQAFVRSGTQRDAILFSVGVNARHGLRRTNADKRRAVERLLRDEEWVKFTNAEIARRTFVDRSTVARLRKALEQEGEIGAVTKRVGRDGQIIDSKASGDGGRKGSKSRMAKRENQGGAENAPLLDQAIAPKLRKPATVVVEVEPNEGAETSGVQPIEVTSEQNSPSDPLVSHNVHIFETIERGVDPGKVSQGAAAVVLPWEKLMWVASRMKHTEFENATSVPVFIEDGQRWFVVHMKSPAKLSPAYATLSELRIVLEEAAP